MGFNSAFKGLMYIQFVLNWEGNVSNLNTRYCSSELWLLLQKRVLATYE